DILGEQRPSNPKTFADNDYGTPRQLTFFTPGQPPQSENLLSSARALNDFLEHIAKNKKPSDIKTLALNNKAQFYRKDRGVRFSSGALEWLSSTFSKMRPIHFSALTTLQLYMSTNSAPVIHGVKDLLGRQCLPQLQTLDLCLAGICLPSR